MGIDTVELAGSPFELTVAEGMEIEIGDHLATLDLSAIEKNSKETTVIVVITNSSERINALDAEPKEVHAGEPAALIQLKT